MSTFLRKFLQEDTKGGTRAYLAAFGKHPGWNDHIDDLGIETDSLVMAKQTIYLDGLSSQIDAGAWEKLDAESRLDGFDHVLLWQRGANSMLGLMVSSSDGKGRTRYPMILCAQFVGVPLPRVLREMWPPIEAAMAACRATSNAADVRRIVTTAREALRAAIARPESASAAKPAEVLGGQEVLGADNEGLLRVLYQIQNQLDMWAPGRKLPDPADGAANSAHVRVPQVFKDVGAGLTAWCSFLAPQLNPAAPRLLLWPRAGTWLDVIIGHPSGADFFGLRANERSVPGAHAVPYKMDEMFRLTAAAFIAQQGSAAAPNPPPAAAAAREVAARPPARDRSSAPVVARPRSRARLGWIIGVGAGLIAAAIFGALWFTSPEMQAPEKKTETPPAPLTGTPEKVVPPPASTPDPVLALPAATSAAAPAPLTGDVGEAWSALCDGYYVWLGGLLSALNDTNRRNRWSRDEHLKKDVIDPIAAARDVLADFDPRKLAGVTRDLQSLAKSPPPALDNAEVRDKVLAARQAMHALATALQKWPHWKQALDSTATMHRLGWTGLTDAPALPDRLKLDGTLATMVDRLLDTRDTITPVAKLAEPVLAQLSQLSGAGDTALTTSAENKRRELLATTTIAKLQPALLATQKALAPAIALLNSDWAAGKIDRDRLAGERDAAWANGLALDAVFARWAEITIGFTKVSEEEMSPAKNAQRPLATRAHELIEQLSALASPAEANPFQLRLNEWFTALAKLHSVPLVRKDLPAHQQKMAELAANLEKLVAELTAEVARRVDPAGWTEQLRSVHFAESAVIDTAWQSRREALLKKWDPPRLAGDLPQFREARAQMNRLEKFFREVAVGEGLSAPKIADAQLAPEITRELQLVADQAREADLTRLLELAVWNDGVPAATSEELLGSPPAKELIAAHVAASSALVEFGRTLAQIQAGLAAGVAWQDGLAKLYQPWSALAHDRPEIVAQPKLAENLARFAALDQLAASSDREALVVAARAPGWSTAVTAWWRLGELPDWPRALDLGRELDLSTALRGRLGAEVPDQAVRTPFEARIADERKRRWKIALASADQDAAIDSVLNLMEAAGVIEGDLDDRSKANLLLRQLRRKEWLGMNNPSGREERAAAVASLRKIGGVDARLTKLADELAAVSFEKGAIDFSQYGPGRHGWTLANGGTAARLRYDWTSPGGLDHKLEFIAVAASGDGGALAVTEMPVQLFIDWVAARNLWPTIIKANKLLLDDFEGDTDPRTGPRSYLIVADKATGKPERFERGRQNWLLPGVDIYPDKEKPAGPDEDVPLNYVSYRAAKEFAESLGCRLPTESEWQAARQASAAHQDGSAAPNLRDARWLRQLVHQKSKLKNPCLPDSDIFLPGPPLRAEIVVGPAAKAATPDDDGNLWFAKVEAGSPNPFWHLIGNVAEFVTAADGAIGVVGGSALSPPELKIDQMYEVNARDDTRGFSDVGFRLAFSIERSSGGAEVQRILLATPYLR